jgi:hypothetical protein
MKESSTAARDESGQLLPGHTANPQGNNGHLAGWQRYGDRAQKLAEKFTTEEILEYGRDDDKRAKDLSFWDGQVVFHMARTIDKRLTATDSGGDHVNKEREALIDRIEGKSAQPFVPAPDVLNGVNSDQKMLDTALKIAFILQQGLKVRGLTLDHALRGKKDDVESTGQATDGPPSGG